jgi:hypothetical protein
MTCRVLASHCVLYLYGRGLLYLTRFGAEARRRLNNQTSQRNMNPKKAKFTQRRKQRNSKARRQ